MSDSNQFQKVCDLDDIWQGEMELFELDGQEVLIVHTEDGEVKAYDPVCPHQDHPLIEGEFSNCILTCSAHHWQFDVVSGKGVNPVGVSLNAYPVKVEDEAVFVVLPSKSQVANA